MREELEVAPTAQGGYRSRLDHALTEVDRRIARRAMIIADLEERRRDELGEAES